MDELSALGGAKQYIGLEPIACAPSVDDIVLISDEVTAVCPITGQPDQYTVRIQLCPSLRALESKSLKLYLQAFRNRGIFCEALAAEILDAVVDATAPWRASVTVTQKSRGGIRLAVVARWSEADEDEAALPEMADAVGVEP